ncbi:hypothetical protein [Demequina muriae]|uniref:Uncharacterized protein n=1 Tax=Demequina muriae TaxID=3051664 RepID=A0ABT8GGZ6_9MICO|nr:hypothetical protein [Demequina sp. EGI L300058]MDN4480624.1 hypothetical protein [Demequina sp. EGI L300058]
MGDNGADGLEPMVSHSPSAEPSPTMSSSPTAEPTPDASASAPLAGPPLDDSADGIPEDGYPPLAPDRNSAVTAEAHVTYPEALVMEEWVWDRAGSGWSLEIASVQMNFYTDDWTQPPAVLYLVSPEERYFELTELPERTWDDARVVSWREGHDTAMIWWAADDAEHGRAGFGGAVDLRSGEVDDLSMAVYGETAWDHRFVMANASGDELWRAESEAGFKYNRWSDGADEDGWVASAVVDEFPSADAASFYIGSERPITTADGDRVLLRPSEELSQDTTTMTLFAYDLAADEVTSYRFDRLPRKAELMHAFFDGSDSVYALLHYPVDPDSSASHNNSHGVRVSLAGEGSIERIEYDDEGGSGDTERRRIGFGESSPRSVAREDCGC